MWTVPGFITENNKLSFQSQFEPSFQFGLYKGKALDQRCQSAVILETPSALLASK